MEIETTQYYLESSHIHNKNETFLNPLQVSNFEQGYIQFDTRS